ncbi:uncharacterized protein CLUP02_01859 [Colletotrichum lupini]|uniref:Uncharacterized protein n=1 Tax=Colletotrichum lupini TaxID=145971 RepID=A0A9Q8SDZ6_9PEZI|nr:uncharacterized protein CLUP02_01859 [Colletotrichum lupini]UQC75206.1 hypothetical protein CLUP02_01859 [Colletotrichum lupini]
MASETSRRPNVPRAQSSLDRNRKRWFIEFEQLQTHSRREKEQIAARFSQEHRDVCHDLDEEAHFAVNQSLPLKARELLENYQLELRRHRWAYCKQSFSSVAMHDSCNGMLGWSSARLPGQDSSDRTSPGADALGRATPSLSAGATPDQSQKNLLPRISAGDLFSVPNTLLAHTSPATMPSQLEWRTRQAQQLADQIPHNQGRTSFQHDHVGDLQLDSLRMPIMYKPSGPACNPAANAMQMLPSHSHGLISGPHHRSMRPVDSDIDGPHHRALGCGDCVPLPALHPKSMSSREEQPRPNSARPPPQGSMSRVYQFVTDATHGLPGCQSMAKRKPDAGDVPNQRTATKRMRNRALKSIAPRSITFGEVFQSGKAEYKHNIVKFEGVFYILRCDEHGVHFKQNALAAGAKHLHGASHGYLRKEHKLAVETIGFHVVDCTEELAAMNNESVDKRELSVRTETPVRDLSASDLTFQTPSSGDRSYEAQSTTKNTESKQHDVSSMITNPKAGELYYARWQGSNKAYIVLILGWTSLDMCGWKRMLGDTQLCNLRNRPSCYTYNDEGISGWASGYGDNEPRTMDRDVPVLWFENKSKTFLGWLGVKYILEPVDLEDLNRSHDPLDACNQARKKYAEVRGYNSFEALLTDRKSQRVASGDAKAKETIAVASIKLPPSSASVSESDIASDVDMHEPGDIPPLVEVSNHEDYIDLKSSRDGNVRESDDEMNGNDDHPAGPPQSDRRSIQVMRPPYPDGESSRSSGGSATAAGRSQSTIEEKRTADLVDTMMHDAVQISSLSGHTPQKDVPERDRLLAE